MDYLRGLKTAKKIGETLGSKGITLSILRKGKKALSLGRDAKPTLSILVIGTDIFGLMTSYQIR